MPYVAPSAGSSNAFKSRETTTYVTDPNELIYKNLKPGDYVDLRFLTFEEEAFMQIKCRKATITNPKTGSPMTISVVDLGYEVMSELTDSTGTPLNECKLAYVYRLPVWVYRKRHTDKTTQEVVVTPVNKLMYIEFGPGLAKSLEALEGFQDGVGAFNPETSRPDYDVRLKIITGQNDSIPKNYEFEPIMFVTDPKTRKKVTAPSFGQDAETALGKANLKLVSETWDSVIESMTSVPDKAEVLRQLSKKTDDKPSNSVANKPTVESPIDESQYADAVVDESVEVVDSVEEYSID